MLFLAVFLGFVAENFRDHSVEHSREMQYIRSIIEDLRLDLAEFSNENIDRRQSIDMYDSVILLLNQQSRTAFKQQRIYYLMRMSLRLSPFPLLNDRTYEQMKSSGNLRLIRDQTIADRITKYYFNSKDLSINSSQFLLRLQSLIDFQGKVFDGTVFQKMINLNDFSINPPQGNPALISENKETVNELVTRIHYVLSLLLYTQNNLNRLKNEGTELIKILKKEYHL